MAEQALDARVGKLEYRADKVDERVDKMDGKMDTNHQRIWERLDMHRDVQLETKVKVEEVGKDVSDLNTKMGKLVDSQNSFITNFNEKLSNQKISVTNRWEQFFSKAFWLLIGAIVTLIFAKVKGWI